MKNTLISFAKFVGYPLIALSFCLYLLFIMVVDTSDYLLDSITNDIKKRNERK